MPKLKINLTPLSKPNIVIACSSLTNKAEPFIEDIKQHINARIYYLYGDNFPDKADGFGSLSYYPNLWNRFYRKLRNIPTNHLQEGMERFLKLNKIDLVLSEYGTVAAKMSLVCAKLSIPHIAHFHGGDMYIKENIINFKKEYSFLFETASGIIGVSEDMTHDLIQLGAKIERCQTIPCAPQERFFLINPEFQKPIFLFVGRFTDKKAPYYTLAAFKKVLDILPDANLIMAGDGELLNTCENLVTFWEMNHAVSFTGRANHAQLNQYFSQASCYVQHSIIAANGDCEGTPVSILEASAAGLPVISTRHKGIKQAVIHGQTGYLVEEHDVNGMAKFMIELANDLHKSKLMGEAGRKHIRQNYSMEKYIGAIDDLINRTLYFV